ncbi:MAG: LD-carboxypeptidase [Bacteroidales bacterium]|nr:LD-carboxypeptidase [Bacteroidales bacterium]
MKKVQHSLSILWATAILLLLAMQPVATHAQGPNKTLKCVAPAYLKAGDKVALITPSYYGNVETTRKAAKVLKSWGFKPVIAPNVGKKHLDLYAGTSEERLADLRWALNDPDIKAIICMRGGYGSLQLADLLPLQELTDSPKWIVGFSDATTLLGMENCAGVMSIHGIMGSNIASRGGADLSCTLLRDLLKGQQPIYELPANFMNIPGQATGVLVGGNLATFAPLLSSQADLFKNTNIILFIEDVDETYHSLDRFFNMLKISGALSRCKGVILGSFKDCKDDLGYGNVENMFREYIEPYHIPLLCGFPAGHVQKNLPLILGAPVTLDVRSDGSTLSFSMPGSHKTVQTEGLPFLENLPEFNSSSFVNITDVIPDAILEIRYYSTYNFVGERIDGYQQPTALMTKRAADSLKAVSDEVMRMGYRLKIYDAYRPQMAVDHFVRWAADIPDTLMKRYFYPEVDKSLLLVQNYIAAKSGHTRGSTVDLTLFDMTTEKELDMGGTFDWFGEESHPDFGGDPETGIYNGKPSPAGRTITAEQFRNRMILRAAMLRHGFKPIDEEWWHFTLKDEPYPETYFEFPVKELR